MIARGSLLCGALLLATTTAWASPQDLFGYGARAMAMGGTGAAYADDVGAVFANPAGLSRSHELALTLGLVGSAFWLDHGGAHTPADPGAATVIGVTMPIPFGGALRDRVTLGLGFLTPTQVVVRARILRPETPQFINLPDRVQTVALQAGVGLDLGRGFRLGAGISALAGLTGSVLVTTDARGRAGSRIDDSLVASFAPIVGLSWERGPWRVGAAYRGSLSAQFLVTIEARDLGVMIPVLNISGVAQYDPAQLALEAAWQHRGWTAAVALTGKRWSEYPGPVQATTENSPEPPPPEFHDTLVARAGVERRWVFPDETTLSLRGGWFYEPTPAAPSTPARRLLDNDRHAVTLGLSYGARAAGTRFTVDIAGQVHLLVRRTVLDGAREVDYGGAVLSLASTFTVSF